ncbi:MAG: hypothetical protein M3478_06835, partial [Planctomycetota bacterium]|nr:hypothetical protein [Planctomycetota bacterium]
MASGTTSEALGRDAVVPITRGWTWGALAAAVSALAWVTLRSRNGASRRMRRPVQSAESVGYGAAERRLNAAAATIASSVLADSALEHFRGGLYRPAMFLAPAVSAITVCAGLTGAGRRATAHRFRTRSFAAATVVGVAGFGYHVYNVSRREGGWSWGNLFYGAPIAAPLALHMAGLLGLIAGSLEMPGSRIRVVLGQRPARPVAALTVMGLFGTSAETALLHFRGAFQDPYMYLPVTLAPAAGAALCDDNAERPLADSVFSAAAVNGASRVRRRWLSRVRRAPQHGRLAQLDAERSA